MFLFTKRGTQAFFLIAMVAIFFIPNAYAKNYNTSSNINTNNQDAYRVEAEPFGEQVIIEPANEMDEKPELAPERVIIQSKPEAEFKAQHIKSKEIVPLDNNNISSNSILKFIQQGRVNNVRFKNLNELQNVYANNNYEPIFLKSTAKSQNVANEYYNVILDSWSHGLNPSKYHSLALFEFLSLDAQQITQESVLKADIILTDAIIRLGQDLTGARIIPSNLGYHAPSINKGAIASEIIEFVTRYNDPKKAFDSMVPRGDLYNKMRDELMRVYSLPPSATNKINVSGLIKPRTNNSAIPKIRERMGSRKDNLANSDNFYDDELASHIMEFQRANGLKDDGVIGPATMNVMNLSNEGKIKKLIVNMERIRWEDKLKPDRYILVNIPNETLWAVNNGHVEIKMAVVVGRPERATQIFNANITGVRVNPTWTIPPTIKREDFATKLRKDAAYLDNRGIKVYQGGQRIDSTSIDWTTVSDGELGKYRMVQGPSSANPLGRFRVIMDNPYNIYLHDTPTKSYFARSNRALSSGCVRMEDAEKVVDFILRTNPNWTDERKEELLNKDTMTVVSAEESLPVYLQYKTVWIGEGNNLIFGNDIYNEDDKLFGLLKNQGDIFVPDKLNI